MTVMWHPFLLHISMSRMSTRNGAVNHRGPWWKVVCGVNIFPAAGCSRSSLSFRLGVKRRGDKHGSKGKPGFVPIRCGESKSVSWILWKQAVERSSLRTCSMSCRCQCASRPETIWKRQRTSFWILWSKTDRTLSDRTVKLRPGLRIHQELRGPNSMTVWSCCLTF